MITISHLLLSKRKTLRTQGHSRYLPIISACDAASLGSWLPIFWNNTVVSSWLVDIAKKNVLLDNVTLEYQTITFSRNVWKHQPVSQNRMKKEYLSYGPEKTLKLDVFQGIRGPSLTYLVSSADIMLFLITACSYTTNHVNS